VDETEIRLQFRNSENKERILHLEPWGEQYPMVPGDVFELIARGPNGGGLELEIENGAIMLWAWSGSTVWLFHNGVEVPMGVSGERPRVPPIPTRND
jgi:hypothetical protein